MVDRLTREQAAIVGLFTGALAGPFADLQEYAERLMGGPVWTHELAVRADEFKEMARLDFLSICAEERDEAPHGLQLRLLEIGRPESEPLACEGRFCKKDGPADTAGGAVIHRHNAQDRIPCPDKILHFACDVHSLPLAQSGKAKKPDSGKNRSDPKPSCSCGSE